MSLGKPVAGKTGTSNDERDAWFIGYTPDLAVGVYVGYDNPKPMGKKRTGGELAAPIVTDFMKLALKDKAAIPFRVPRAIELIPINAINGKRAIFGEEGTILEAFKPGDEPPENTRLIGRRQTAAMARAKEGRRCCSGSSGTQTRAPSQPKAGGLTERAAASIERHTLNRQRKPSCALKLRKLLKKPSSLSGC